MTITDEHHVRLQRGSKKAFEELLDLAVQEALRMLPHTVDRLMKQAMSLQKLSVEFYQNNPDLAEHRELVSKMIERIEAENPGVDPRKITEQAAPKVRSLLQEKAGFDLKTKPIPRLSTIDAQLRGLGDA